MKNIIIIVLGIILSSYTAYSQNEIDALRYSQSFYEGTSRAAGMGGAFSALGGDMSSIGYNPAGIGIYKTSEFSFSPAFYFQNSNSNYNSSLNSGFKYNLNFSNFGIVGTYNSEDNDWKNVNFGFSYNKLNNFNKNIYIEGYNSSGSMTDYFAHVANGKATTNFNEFNERLAYDAYLIDPLDTLNYTYITALPNYGETQSKTITSYGGHGDYNFTLGANYNNIFYIGGAIGIQTINYTEDIEYTEKDNFNVINNFNEFTYKQHLNTRGTGFNFKFGSIFKPVDWVRVGLAIHTPTFYDLTDNYNSSINSIFTNANYEYKSPNGEFNYQLATPFKAIGSLGFIIQKSAIVGIDYEFIDYSIARLGSSDYNFKDENNNIEKSYTPTGNVRAGIEYKFGPFSFRGGFGFYGSPYKSNQINKNAFTTSYSGGFGIRDNNVFFDFAYVYMTSKENHYLYDPSFVNTANSTVLNPTKLILYSSQFMATIGFKF